MLSVPPVRCFRLHTLAPTCRSMAGAVGRLSSDSNHLPTLIPSPCPLLRSHDNMPVASACLHVLTDKVQKALEPDRRPIKIPARARNHPQSPLLSIHVWLFLLKNCFASLLALNCYLPFRCCCSWNWVSETWVAASTMYDGYALPCSF